MLCQADRDVLDQWAEMGGVPADVQTRDYLATHLVLKLWESHREVEATLLEIVSKVRPTCDEFRAGEGAAHPWCRVCGWRRDLHDAAPAAAVEGQLSLADLLEPT